MMQPQINECWQPQKPESQGLDSPLNPLERVQPCWHLDVSPVMTDYELMAYRIVTEKISVVFIQKVYGNLLQQSRETNTTVMII